MQLIPMMNNVAMSRWMKLNFPCNNTGKRRKMTKLIQRKICKMQWSFRWGWVVIIFWILRLRMSIEARQKSVVVEEGVNQILTSKTELQRGRIMKVLSGHVSAKRKKGTVGDHGTDDIIEPVNKFQAS
ncbi:conserved hypothetical protein [Ricinus communis]|uniref:Uncharacterized protein n=1 Tax=Ricinus communis TaxID=3988 RepID=B9SZ82_RICCO|nr:conserved hypothetical protein [Ricinus communis]